MPDALEDPHVFAAGKDIGAAYLRIDAVDAPCDVFAFVQVAARKFLRKRREKIAVNDRFVPNGRDLARLHFRGIDDLKMSAEKGFRFLLRLLFAVKEMKGIKIFVMRIDPVTRKPAAQTVGTIVHDRDRLDHSLAAHGLAAPVYNARDRAARRVSELTFI